MVGDDWWRWPFFSCRHRRRRRAGCIIKRTFEATSFGKSDICPGINTCFKWWYLKWKRESEWPELDGEFVQINVRALLRYQEWTDVVRRMGSEGAMYLKREFSFSTRKFINHFHDFCKKCNIITNAKRSLVFHFIICTSLRSTQEQDTYALYACVCASVQLSSFHRFIYGNPVRIRTIYVYPYPSSYHSSTHTHSRKHVCETESVRIARNSYTVETISNKQRIKQIVI